MQFCRKHHFDIKFATCQFDQWFNIFKFSLNKAKMINDYLNMEKINCPIFTKKYNQILDNKQKVNRSVRGIEKTIYAEDFEEGINQLLRCETYDLLKMDCLNCRIVANLQMKSAEMMLHLKVPA